MLQFNRRLTADLALFMITVIWGVTFVTVKTALQDIGVFSFLAIRFFIAFLFLAIVFFRRWSRIDWPTFKAGGILSLWLFAGYAFQTVGLLYTSASNAGFITGLAVVLVPCLAAFYTRRMPGPGIITAILLAVSGLGLLTLSVTFTFSYGDALVLLCAASFAMQIFLLGRYAPLYDASLITMLQIGLTGLLSAVAALVFEPHSLHITPDVWTALAITAIPATSLAFLVQTWAQQFTTPSRTVIIFALEPVIAALTGIYYLGESLTLLQMFGCVLILASTLASELLPESKTEAASPAEELP